jgi:hypothetical protein
LTVGEDAEDVYRLGQIEADGKERLLGRQGIPVHFPEQDDRDGPDDHCDQPGGDSQGKANARGVRGEQDDRGQERYRRNLKDAEDESQAEECHGEPSERTEQRGEGSRAAEPVDAKRADRLHHTAYEARKNSHVPGERCIVRAVVHRNHDQRDVGEDRRRVHAEGNRGDVAAARAARQTVRLPRVKQIAEENRKSYGGKNAAGDEFRRQAAQRREACDQEQVGKTAEEKAEKTIEVARNKPARPGVVHCLGRPGRLGCASDERGLAS